MTKIRQSLITIVGAMALSLILLQPITVFFIEILKPISSSSIFGGIEPNFSYGFAAFLYAFIFFLTILEFFFPKQILERRPYVYFIGFFLFMGLSNAKSLLVMVVLIIMGALPGILFNLLKSKNKNKVAKLRQ